MRNPLFIIQIIIFAGVIGVVVYEKFMKKFENDEKAQGVIGCLGYIALWVVAILIFYQLWRVSNVPVDLIFYYIRLYD